MMTIDSAWRQLRTYSRDQAVAEQKLLGARNVWRQTLIEQMEERLEEAKERGLDIADPKTLWAMGVPCVTCLTIVTAARKGRHKLFSGGQNSPSIYADECGAQPIDPRVEGTVMPEWPPIPQGKTEGEQ